jgi:cob(I)alamin adenosyltransferase
MIIVFTGNGKGKTTASLGQMMRVLGRGRAALMIQFIKGSWTSGEDLFAETFKIPDSKFKIRKMGLGFVGILGDKLPKEEHQKAAEAALEFFKKELADAKWHLMVLDEINNAVSLGLLTVAQVVEAIKDFPEEKLLILTGRDAPKEFIELADLATEMKELKHPYNDFKLGKNTVEF